MPTPTEIMRPRAGTTDTTCQDPNTPDDVLITMQAPAPFSDPTVGVDVPPPKGESRHRLVVLGDSLSHGFQSGAIYNTHISYPAIIAYEMGYFPEFRYPSYPGFGGLPLNIELLIRELEERFGERIDWWESALAVFRTQHFMGEVEDWWERGPGSTPPARAEINHNLAVYGWDVRDTLSRTYNLCKRAIHKPKQNLLLQVVENANERAALRVLPDPAIVNDQDMAPIDAAEALGADGGIENLIIMIGANNALGSVAQLKIAWSQDNVVDGVPAYQHLEAKAKFTVWRPTHFQAEVAALAERVKGIQAQNVIWVTVPHVTIAPIARGVDRKVRVGSRYFPFYTRPWISDADFDTKDDPNITESQARAVDSAIDQYNDAIALAVKEGREEGRNWLLFDLAGLLDRLAARRYQVDPTARPSWWRAYDLPNELASLNPRPDSRFFASNASGRIQGGLFALDGIHPTTVGYGVVAQEIIQVLQRHGGVKFFLGDGVTERTEPIRVDFNRLIALDTLISDPPRSVLADLALMGWLDQRLDVISRLFRKGI